MTSPEHGPPKPSHEGELIRRARLARGLSPDEAAERTPIRLKGFRWRQIEDGRKRKSDPPGSDSAPDKTVAHMASTVGVTPDRLAEFRPEAAEILREILVQRAGESASLPDPLDALDPERQRIILDMLAQLPAEDRGPALRRLAQKVEAGGLEGATGSAPPVSLSDQPLAKRSPEKRTG